MEIPTSDYIAGYRQANSDAGKCGARNPDSPTDRFALCIRQRGHTGMHDDSWAIWGDRDATAEQNTREAMRERLRA